MESLNVLFICSRNEWRSRTAETIFKKVEGLQVQSAGTSPQARIRVNAKHLQRAEVIFVMESKHKAYLIKKFGQLLDHKKVIVLEIPDDYKYMDKDLIQHLEDAVNYHLNEK